MAEEREELSWKSVQGQSRWSLEQARWVISEFERSGLSGQAFAQEHGLHARRLYYWRARLLGKTKVAPGPTFVEVKVPKETCKNTEPRRQAERIKIRLLSGRSITIIGDVELPRLESLVALLERPLC